MHDLTLCLPAGPQTPLSGVVCALVAAHLISQTLNRIIRLPRLLTPSQRGAQRASERATKRPGQAVSTEKSMLARTKLLPGFLLYACLAPTEFMTHLGGRYRYRCRYDIG